MIYENLCSYAMKIKFYAWILVSPILYILFKLLSKFITLGLKILCKVLIGKWKKCYDFSCWKLYLRFFFHSTKASSSALVVLKEWCQTSVDSLLKDDIILLLHLEVKHLTKLQSDDRNKTKYAFTSCYKGFQS